MAIQMFNLKGKGSDQYFKEVEDKLIEETNYTLELKKPKKLLLHAEKLIICFCRNIILNIPLRK
jgi:hypothetical protein